MTKPILQTKIPDGVPWKHAPAARLPGLSPLPLEDWLLQDDAFAEQMAFKDNLIAEHRRDVIATTPGATQAALECLDTILNALGETYTVTADAVTRPDGVTVPINRADPLATIGRLVQQDTCLMQASPKGYVLTAAVLCFPASWTLAEKIGKPLLAIHRPVAKYDANLAKRVDRLFQAIKPGTVLTRANLLFYEKPDLFAPCTEDDQRAYLGANYLRTERQTLRRLPNSNAVVFGIHTTVMDAARLPKEERNAALKAAAMLE